MSKLITTIATIATVALASVPALALATGANAAPVSVKVSDLDLSSPDGKRVFDQRVDAAAKAFCRDQQPMTGSRIVRNDACIAGVRVEIAEKAAAAATRASQPREVSSR